MDDWRYLATLFQDFMVLCNLQTQNDTRKKSNTPQGRKNKRQTYNTCRCFLYKVIFQKWNSKKTFQTSGIEKRRSITALPLFPQTLSTKNTHPHTKKIKNTGQVTDWQKTIQHRWERYKNNVYLLDFLKGAFPNGSDESEPDMTKSSLLLTFDIPEKKILNQKQYSHLTLVCKRVWEKKIKPLWYSSCWIML